MAEHTDHAIPEDLDRNGQTVSSAQNKDDGGNPSNNGSLKSGASSSDGSTSAQSFRSARVEAALSNSAKSSPSPRCNGISTNGGAAAEIGARFEQIVCC